MRRLITMSEERKRILQMLADGKISADEADELLATLGSEKESKSIARKEAKFLRIKVTEFGQEKVNVNIPLSLAKLAMKFIPNDAKMKMEEKEIDLDEIIREIQYGAPAGKIVEVEDGEDRVEVFIE